MPHFLRDAGHIVLTFAAFAVSPIVTSTAPKYAIYAVVVAKFVAHLGFRVFGVKVAIVPVARTDTTRAFSATLSPAMPIFVGERRT